MTGLHQPPASHFIDGGWLDDASGAPFDSTDPATGAVLARLHGATRAVLDRALDAAARAQPAWAALKPVERGRVLRRAADLMRARNEELSVLETRDTGKPIAETRVADAASGADCLEYFAGIAALAGGETIPLGPDWAYTLREPHGVCAGIGAWNYPIQIACWKAAPALAMGNALVFKPSELTPLSALTLAAILTEAGLPPGVFGVVQGDGAVGAALAGDGRIAKVSLTGSVATGRRVAAAAGEAMRAATMELGGKSPLIVFDDAGLADAVAAAMLANFYSAGQICSNGTRVFVQRALYDAFRDRLLARVAAIRIGDPMDPRTTMGPLASLGQRDRVLGFLGRARAAGARIVGGQALPGPGAFLTPAVVDTVSDDAEIAREEVFGPVLTLLPFDTEAEVVARANASPYGLAAGIFTRDIARAHRVVAALQAGTCWINSYNVTPVEMPFGGVKLSGMGRENGRAAVAAWSRVKSVHVGMGPVESPFEAD